LFEPDELSLELLLAAVVVFGFEGATVWGADVVGRLGELGPPEDEADDVLSRTFWDGICCIAAFF
jgi:hypothetical protein